METSQWDDVLAVLQENAQEKPWMTARTIARRLRHPGDRIQIEKMLLAHYSECEEPKVRCSSLPSRRTLEVLWAASDKVGCRYHNGFIKKDPADDSFADFGETCEASVFLSHSHHDYEAVMSIARQLLDNDLVPWLAETHIQQDEHIHERIIRALGDTQVFLLFLSSHSLNSCWTGKEYSYARGGTPPVPLCVVANIDELDIPENISAIGDPGRADIEVLSERLVAEVHEHLHLFAYSGRGSINPMWYGTRPHVRRLEELPSVIRGCIHKPHGGS
jgi:hypothetical protein